MNESSKLDPLDKAAILAALTIPAGAGLPFSISHFSHGTASVNYMHYGEGFFAILVPVAAILFISRRKRIGAMATFAGMGLLVLWRILDADKHDDLSLGVGAYVMLTGIVGGLLLLAIYLASPSGEHRDVEVKTPPHLTKGY